MEEMNQDDWTSGTYGEIQQKYDRQDFKDFPLIHPVDILSIATWMWMISESKNLKEGIQGIMTSYAL